MEQRRKHREEDLKNPGGHISLLFVLFPEVKQAPIHQVVNGVPITNHECVVKFNNLNLQNSFDVKTRREGTDST